MPFPACRSSRSFIHRTCLLVSGGRQRERNAAIHEIVLAAGFAVGSFGGGVLGQVYGVRTVYGIVAGVIAAALFLQVGYLPAIVGAGSRNPRR